MEEPLFEVAGAQKSYRLGQVRVPALRGVDLAIGRGELVAVTGPSGSGKTTLLNLLGALDRPDSGRVRFDGEDLGAAAEGRRTLIRRRGLGFVFQTFNLVPVLSALENVEYPLWIAGTGRRERRRRAREALEGVGLGPRARHRPDQLSGGERQRVAIARALVHRPLAVLADEPTGQLDTETASGVLDLLEELHRHHGVTVVLATHDPEVIARAPRRVRLVDGRVAAEEAPAPPGEGEPS